jgi:O-antigen ligase
MRFAAASFFALAVVAAQFAHGGYFEPFLPFPAYALVCLGVVCSLPAVFGRRQPWPALVVALGVFAVYVIWRCAVAQDAWLATRDAALFLACAGVWAGMALAVTRNDARFVFLLVCAAAGLAQVVVATIQLVHPGQFSQPYWLSEMLRELYAGRFAFRPHGLFMNPNHFAWLMNMLALLTLSLGVWGRLGVARRLGVLYLAAVFGVMAILSASRGGMVSLVAGFAVFVALSLVALIVAVKHRRFVSLFAGGLVVVICAAAAYAAFSTSWIAQSRADALTSPESRAGFVEQAIRLFQTEPLLGVGPGVFKYAARLYRTGTVWDDPIFAHNDWLQFAAEYGFVGLALVIVAVALAATVGVRSFLALVRLASTETGVASSTSGAFVLGAFCGLAATAVHSIVDFNMHIPANALLASALLGIVTGARPTEFDAGRSRLRTGAWLAAAASVAVVGGLGWLLCQRWEAEYHALRAEDALLRTEIGKAGEEADKGLAKLPDDPLLLALRGRAYFEYEAWLLATTPGRRVPAPLPDEEAVEEPEPPVAEDGESAKVEEDFYEEPGVELTPEESAKNFRAAAELYARAAKAQPLERRHRTGLALALGALGEQEAARASYEEAIRLDPSQARPWADYADFFADQEAGVSAARRLYEIGAQLPGGAYAAEQVGLIDEERRFDEEIEREEAASATQQTSP